jgi:hypothetical protein
VNRSRIWLTGLIVTVLVAFACVVLTETTVLSAQSNKAPQFTLKDLNGKTYKLSQFKGKVIVINWFATW